MTEEFIIDQTPFIQVFPNKFSFPSYQVLGAWFTRTLPLGKQYFNQRVKSKLLRGLWQLRAGFVSRSQAVGQGMKAQ